ncbi:MAG: signal peptidase [Fimbriiglobus sp.]|jgi:cell fate regulator YaaT (PSP1 superfamily)|nr:signal peptidase [Fimbriiglobus sp.]
MTHPLPSPNAPDRTRFIVRHGAVRLLGEFIAPERGEVRRRDVVILRTPRGTEHGEVLGPSSPQAVAHIPDPTSGAILRVATDADLQRIAELATAEACDLEIGVNLVRQHRLAMQLVSAERLFGGERVLFYFLAEHRVDFRELVKAMAREFHARIELRQIGVRDEAKLKADYGDCGRPVCCNTFLMVMPPVSMRMAKLQKSTLDPTKISGRCGRLKCCLRYEQDVYEAHQEELPKAGSRVLTRQGQGRVLAVEVLARRLMVEFEDGRRQPVTADEVLTKL